MFLFIRANIAVYRHKETIIQQNIYYNFQWKQNCGIRNQGPYILIKERPSVHVAYGSKYEYQLCLFRPNADTADCEFRVVADKTNSIGFPCYLESIDPY